MAQLAFIKYVSIFLSIVVCVCATPGIIPTDNSYKYEESEAASPLTKSNTQQNRPLTTSLQPIGKGTSGRRFSSQSATLKFGGPLSGRELNYATPPPLPDSVTKFVNPKIAKDATSAVGAYEAPEPPIIPEANKASLLANSGTNIFSSPLSYSSQPYSVGVTSLHGTTLETPFSRIPAQITIPTSASFAATYAASAAKFASNLPSTYKGSSFNGLQNTNGLPAISLSGNYIKTQAPSISYGQPVEASPISTSYGVPVAATSVPTSHSVPVAAAPISASYGLPVATSPVSTSYGAPVAATSVPTSHSVPVAASPISASYGLPVPTSPISSIYGLPASSSPVLTSYGAPVSPPPSLASSISLAPVAATPVVASPVASSAVPPLTVSTPVRTSIPNEIPIIKHNSSPVGSSISTPTTNLLPPSYSVAAPSHIQPATISFVPSQYSHSQISPLYLRSYNLPYASPIAHQIQTPISPFPSQYPVAYNAYQLPYQYYATSPEQTIRAAPNKLISLSPNAIPTAKYPSPLLSSAGYNYNPPIGKK